MPSLNPTGHKTFDAIAAKDYVGTGNVISNIQFSSYIRDFNDVECNGFDWKPGDLQSADLKPWKANRSTLGVPSSVLQFVQEQAQDTESLILYCFFHWNRGKRVVHGFAVTRGHEQGHTLLRYWKTGPTHKSHDIVRECVKAISN